MVVSFSLSLSLCVCVCVCVCGFCVSFPVFVLKTQHTIYSAKDDGGRGAEDHCNINIHTHTPNTPIKTIVIDIHIHPKTLQYQHNPTTSQPLNLYAAPFPTQPHSLHLLLLQTTTTLTPFASAPDEGYRKQNRHTMTALSILLNLFRLVVWCVL